MSTPIYETIQKFTRAERKRMAPALIPLLEVAEKLADDPEMPLMARARLRETLYHISMRARIITSQRKYYKLFPEDK